MNTIDEKSALALILSSADMGHGDALAKRLCSKFGSLYNIVNAEEEELCLVKGMNEKKLKIIKSLPNILEAYLKSRIVSASHKINTYKDVIKYFQLTTRDLRFEVFSYALFDVQKRVIDIDSIFRGSISSATIYPREIIDIALSKMARYIVVSHNHPSGLASPSDKDIILTDELNTICLGVDIVLIDHVIITKDKKYSFRKHGMINFLEKSKFKNKTDGEYYA